MRVLVIFVEETNQALPYQTTVKQAAEDDTNNCRQGQFKLNRDVWRKVRLTQHNRQFC